MVQATPVEAAVEMFEENEIADFCMEAAHDMLSEEPRTLTGEFPGNKTRAMGHALAVVEIAEEHGIDAEREYIDEVGYPEIVDTDDELHKILIHLNGGSPEQ